MHRQDLNMVTVRLLQMIFPPEGLQPECPGHSSAEIVTVDTILEKPLIKQEASTTNSSIQVMSTAVPKFRFYSSFSQFYSITN